MELMIQNVGEAPIEAFTMLGDSGTRNCGVSGVIGQFGSGTKHAINVLLRKGIKFRIYSGRIRFDFFATIKTVVDANGECRETYPVICKLSGSVNRTIECGWTLMFGAMDWRDTSMALREFVSNALDCTKIISGSYLTDDLKVAKSHKMVAKSGFTRIFIDFDEPDVKDFYRDLRKHFLHFTDCGDVGKKFLRKNPDSVGPRIYREGVFVRELASKIPSAFDYNFSADQIEIDECRNSSEYALRAAIGQLINKADAETLKTLFQEMRSGKVYEAELDDFYLGYSDSPEVKENWAGAWKEFAGEAVVSTPEISSSEVGKHVRRKGHSVVSLPRVFAKVAQDMGVPTVASVVGKAAAAGRIEVDATFAACEAVELVWCWIVDAGMDRGMECPVTRCFKGVMDGESECMGYYTPGTSDVWIREDQGGKAALITALEEVGHYVTGSTDNSRDFQQFFIDMIVEISV